MDDWAKGKTPRELYEMTKNVLASLPQQIAQATPPAPVAARPPSRDLLYQDEDRWTQEMQAYQQATVNQSIQQAAVPLLQSQAELAKRDNRTDPDNAAVWRKWGPEIDAMVAQLPLYLQANPRTWSEAVGIVRGRHWKELAREEAERLQASRGGAPMSERAGSDGYAPMHSELRPLDKLFADEHPYAKRFKDAGLNAGDVRARLGSMGYNGPDAEKRYVEAITTSRIVLSGKESLVEAGGYR